MQLLANEIVECVEYVWDAMLRFPITRNEVAPVDRNDKDISYTGIVQITGTWAGTVTLELEESVAIMAAAAMLGIPLESVEADETQDVLCELANMIAGNIKALLPGPSNLTLPVVVKGTVDDVWMPNSEVASRIDFLCDGSPVVVALVKKCA